MRFNNDNDLADASIQHEQEPRPDGALPGTPRRSASRSRRSISTTRATGARVGGQRPLQRLLSRDRQPRPIEDALRLDTSGNIVYSAHRGVDLDEAEDEFETTQHGTDEYLQVSGQVPTGMMFIVSGRVRLMVVGDDDVVVEIGTLETGDFLGQTTLTREPVTASAHGLEEVTVVQIEPDRVEELVARKPLLLHDFGRVIEERRATLRRVARRRTPKAVFDYTDGAAEEECR